MTQVMQINIVDSEKQIFSGAVEYFVAPSLEGEVGIYPNHASLLTKLKSGIVRLQLPNEESQAVFAISGGFLEILNNQAIILVDIAERTDSLDEARLIEQKELALAKLKQSGVIGSTDVAKAQASLEIAIAQLKAIEHIKKQARQA